MATEESRGDSSQILGLDEATLAAVIEGVAKKVLERRGEPSSTEDLGKL